MSSFILEVALCLCVGHYCHHTAELEFCISAVALVLLWWSDALSLAGVCCSSTIPYKEVGPYRRLPLRKAFADVFARITLYRGIGLAHRHPHLFFHCLFHVENYK